MSFARERAVLLVIDPVNDFLSEGRRRLESDESRP